MARLHRATLHPTKLELVAAWLPGRRWYGGEAGVDLRLVGAYRFDDPSGAVGVETLLVRAGDDPIYQIPLTYRGAPLDGGDDWLVGTAAHSVLGRRWIYDACGDRLYASVLATAMFAGTGQADEFFEVEGRFERREPTVTVTGSGDKGTDIAAIAAVHRVVEDDPTLILTDCVDLAVVRRPGSGTGATRATGATGATLTGQWSGQPNPRLLAYGYRS